MEHPGKQEANRQRRQRYPEREPVVGAAHLMKCKATNGNMIQGRPWMIAPYRCTC